VEGGGRTAVLVLQTLAEFFGPPPRRGRMLDKKWRRQDQSIEFRIDQPFAGRRIEALVLIKGIGSIDRLIEGAGWMDTYTIGILLWVEKRTDRRGGKGTTNHDNDTTHKPSILLSF
jgi:hypothetical protein